MDRLLFMTAVAVAVAAAVSDVSSHRIPNWLTYPALVGAFALRFASQGWSGLRSALVGMLIAGGLFLVLYVIRAMGAGDVKLMAAVGALAGSQYAVGIVLATAIAGGNRADDLEEACAVDADQNVLGRGVSRGARVEAASRDQP
jgi:prepilin peptidase CpaA